jgi:hypothetical protein
MGRFFSAKKSLTFLESLVQEKSIAILKGITMLFLIILSIKFICYLPLEVILTDSFIQHFTLKVSPSFTPSVKITFLEGKLAL